MEVSSSAHATDLKGGGLFHAGVSRRPLSSDLCSCLTSDRVWRDSHGSCKSSPALLLKMERHTILAYVVPPPQLAFLWSLHSLEVSLCFGLLLLVPPSRLSVQRRRGLALTDGQRGHGGSHADDGMNDLTSLLSHRDLAPAAADNNLPRILTCESSMRFASCDT